MAWECGSNIFSYCKSIFQRYKEDRQIFNKALQIIQVFQKRSDYPYCIEELDEAVSLVLNGPFKVFFFHGYVFTGVESEEDWDPRKCYEPSDDKFIDLVPELTDEEAQKLAEQYRDEAKSFVMTIQPLLGIVFDHERDGMGIKSIAYNKSYNKKKRSLKIIRNDDSALELTLNREEVNFMIEQLSNIFNDKEK